MAKPLPYDVPPAPAEETAYEKLDELLHTLHRAGVLRVLDGFFGQLDEVSAVALDRLDTEEGRNALSNGLILVKTLTEWDPDRTQAFADGFEKGLAAAQQRIIAEKKPGLLSLAALLGDADVQRGLAAVLALLKALGQHLNRELEHRPRA